MRLKYEPSSEQVGHLDSLERITESKNQISRSHPRTDALWAFAVCIIRFTFVFNPFHVSSVYNPFQVGHLENLELITVSKNQIVSIPHTLSNLAELVSFLQCVLEQTRFGRFTCV